MTWLEFFAALAGSLAWPLVVVLVVVIFHDEVAKMFGRVRSLKAPGLSAELDAAQVNTLIVERKLPDRIRSASVALEAEENPQRELMELEDAVDDPSGLVLRSWEELQASIFALRSQHAKRGRPPKQARIALDHLREQEIIDASFVDSVNALHRTRNRVAHGDPLTPVDAQRYSETADRLRRVAEAMLAEA